MSNYIKFAHPNHQSIHAATRKTLQKIKGFSEIKVEKVKEAITKCQVSLISVFVTSS